MNLTKFLEHKSTSDILFVNGDDIVTRQYLESQSIEKLRDFVGNTSLLIVDETRYVEKIGLNHKLIIDHVPNIKVITTGSSSFELAKDIGEHLPSRKFVLKLIPLALMEISTLSKSETMSDSFGKTISSNLRLGVIHVGAAFQPRLNGYCVRTTSFRGWKATPTRI
jgi:predicted AAA+ superfamily ATPase